MSATYIWLYVNNWDWALVRDTAFWYELRNSVTFIFVRCLTLVCWAWTAGFVLGSRSRAIIRVNGVLLCLMLLFAELLGAPQHVAYLLGYAQGPLFPDSNGPLSALAFYREMFPLIVQAVLVAVPSLRGMRQGAHVGRFPAPLRIVLWTVAIATLTAMVIREPGLGFFLRRPLIWQGWQIRLLQLVAYWPVGYMIASAIGRRWKALAQAGGR